MIVVGNRPTQDHFSKVSIYNFSGLKKGYIEMTEKIYLETFEKCPPFPTTLMTTMKERN